MSPLAAPSPPGLAEATSNSLAAWQHHLAELFRTAKDRFPDVVWALTADNNNDDNDNDNDNVLEEVWGHKGVCVCMCVTCFMLTALVVSHCLRTRTSQFPESLFFFQVLLLSPTVNYFSRPLSPQSVSGLPTDALNPRPNLLAAPYNLLHQSHSLC